MGIWIEEREVFASAWERLSEGVAKAGHQLVAWDDRWLEDGIWQDPARVRVEEAQKRFFHVSLGTASRLANAGISGTYCDVDAFSCQAWYKDFAEDLIHQQDWHVTTAETLVGQNAAWFDAHIGPGERFFVRPDSALKPFAGRVLSRAGVTLAALDHGFYYDDAKLPVVIAACREVGEEWRWVVCDGRVVSGSSYDAASHTAREGKGRAESAQYVEAILARDDLKRFGEAVVIDVACVDGTWRIMEFNPLSGASLYGCDFEAIATALLG